MNLREAIFTTKDTKITKGVFVIFVSFVVNKMVITAP
jgi:hypothetical protein